MALAKGPVSEAEYLRRRTTSAMIDALCQTSPPQAHFRDAGRQHEELARRLLALRAAGENTELINDGLIACGEQLTELADLIDWQWGALFDARQAQHG